MEEKAQKVWENANATLAALDRAHVFQHYKCRDFPTFDAKELKAGPLLGKGGFSNVFEVIDIQLLRDEKSIHVKNEETTAITFSDSTVGDNDEDHYDIAEARTFMAQRCLRFGAARYAIKQLRPDLDKLEFARGALDLAMEIKFLSVLSHPNIVKMRAVSNTPRVSLDTFLILDRLYGTLDEKLESWMQSAAMLRGCCGISNDRLAEKELLKDRLLVAYDLTVALGHMHSLRLIYRDIKPENIGFDVRGDVKVFDFGLMQSLEDNAKAKGGYGYNLTAFTGSIPYMAPEIALKEPYDTEADVFSYCMLLWEIVSMEILYPSYSVQDYFVKVCKQNERPNIPKGKKEWPAILQTIVQEGWDRNPQKRPPITRIGMLLRGLLQDMNSEDHAIANRSDHMMNRSRRSMHNNMMHGTSNADRPPSTHNNNNNNLDISGRPEHRSMRLRTASPSIRPSVHGSRPTAPFKRAETIHDNVDKEALQNKEN